MNTSEPFRPLDFDSAAADPRLVGHRLARLRRQQHITPAQQALALGVDMERLTALSSCRIPWNSAEVEMIAARMGWEVGRLADLLGVNGKIGGQG